MMHSCNALTTQVETAVAHQNTDTSDGHLKAERDSVQIAGAASTLKSQFLISDVAMLRS